MKNLESLMAQSEDQYLMRDFEKDAEINRLQKVNL